MPHRRLTDAQRQLVQQNQALAVYACNRLDAYRRMARLGLDAADATQEALLALAKAAAARRRPHRAASGSR